VEVLWRSPRTEGACRHRRRRPPLRRPHQRSRRCTRRSACGLRRACAARGPIMSAAFVVAAVRTPVGKAPNGALRYTRPDELAALVIKEALRRVPAIEPAHVEDVILGCAMPEAEQGLNVARIASLRAGVPITASAVTVN